MRPFILLALLLVNSGCYVELRGGVAGIRGANDSNLRAEPMIGAAVGVVFDMSSFRAAVGGAADGTMITFAGTRQFAVAGPLDARVDFRGGESFEVKKGMRPGFSLGGTFPGGPTGAGRWANIGGVVAPRKWSAATIFAGFDLWFPLGDSTFSIDIAVGPVVALALEQVGITDLTGFGGQGRVTLSFMAPWAIFSGLDESISRTFGRGMNAQELEEYNKTMGQQNEDYRKARLKKQQDDANQNQKEQGDREHFQKCMERGDCDK